MQNIAKDQIAVPFFDNEKGESASIQIPALHDVGPNPHPFFIRREGTAIWSFAIFCMKSSMFPPSG